MGIGGENLQPDSVIGRRGAFSRAKGGPARGGVSGVARRRLRKFRGVKRRVWGFSRENEFERPLSLLHCLLLNNEAREPRHY